MRASFKYVFGVEVSLLRAPLLVGANGVADDDGILIFYTYFQ
jgi:hypothetical protein